MFSQKYFLICIAIFFPLAIYAQDNKATGKFDVLISTASGDLNNDNLPDSVAVLQDTLDDTKPYQLQVFFAVSDSTYKLHLQSDSAIEVESPNGKEGYSNGTSFNEVTIKSGVLSLNTELLRGHYEYKFRYQNGNFELIGFTETYSDGQGILNSSDFNLSTGLRIEKIERYDTGKQISKTQQVIKIKNLPKLQHFTPFSTDLY